jgi:hypothetical protein
MIHILTRRSPRTTLVAVSRGKEHLSCVYILFTPSSRISSFAPPTATTPLSYLRLGALAPPPRIAQTVLSTSQLSPSSFCQRHPLTNLGQRNVTRAGYPSEFRFQGFLSSRQNQRSASPQSRIRHSYRTMSTIPQPPTAAAGSPLRERRDGLPELITDNLETPSLDDRSYRVVKLPNKLEVLLVHDAETDKASAAMDVNVGNFSDPADMPGMAHAVEHLLFMGTKKVSIWLCNHCSKRPSIPSI